MSNKEWYIVFTESEFGLYRYAVEYWLMPVDGFESQKAFNEWQQKFKEYFYKQTAIKERIVAIEPANFISAYSMVKE